MEDKQEQVLQHKRREKVRGCLSPFASLCRFKRHIEYVMENVEYCILFSLHFWLPQKVRYNIKGSGENIVYFTEFFNPRCYSSAIN